MTRTRQGVNRATFATRRDRTRVDNDFSALDLSDKPSLGDYTYAAF